MPSNTIYDPKNVNEFEKQKLNKDATSVSATVPAGTTVNIDYEFAHDSLVMTSVLLVDGAERGDSVHLQVVHPVAGVVFQPITNWLIDPTVVKQHTPIANFPAKLFTGLKLRLVYHSTGATDVWVGFNLDKDKVLV